MTEIVDRSSDELSVNGAPEELGRNKAVIDLMRRANSLPVLLSSGILIVSLDEESVASDIVWPVGKELWF